MFVDCCKMQADGRVAPLNANQRQIEMEMGVSQSGKYVLLVVYVTPKEGKRSHVDVRVHGQGDEPHQAILYECKLSSACRQVVTDDEGKIAMFAWSSGEVASVLMEVQDDADVAIESVVLVPFSDWSLDYMHPKSVCVRRDGKCVSGSFMTAPESTKFDFETAVNAQQQLPGTTIASASLPEEIFDEHAGLVYLDTKEPNVQVRGKVPHSGYYVFIVHYNQPTHPQFQLDVTIRDGQSSVEAHVPAPFCPSNSGCRSVVKQADGNRNFLVSDTFLFNLSVPHNRSIWVDYVYIVPSDEYANSLLEESPIDLTAEFIARCGKNHFQIDALSSEADFCRQSVFALTTEFNSGALPCQCNFEGSYSFECDQFGGQCSCKPGVIGRQCNRCKTGYFGFPNCKPCDCPSTALCDPVTGSCICPPRVTGSRCDQCVSNTYGYDPIIGCEDCSCNALGVHQGNMQCDPYAGQCLCKQNVVGRMCERCSFGYWAFPQCQLCDCDHRGAAEEICDQDTAQCFCKENVHGPSCDTCKPGTFNLQESNPRGCSKCFCFAKASTCRSSSLFRAQVTDMESWTAASIIIGNVASFTNSLRTSHLSELQFLASSVQADLSDFLPEDGVFYFSAPQQYLGNKLTSYGGFLSYTLYYVEGPSSHPQRAPDVIITGSDLTLFHSANHQAESSVAFNVSVEVNERNFVLPSGLPATRENVMVVLKDVRAIYLRGLYSDPTQTVRLSDVTLEIAVKGFSPIADIAVGVEQCQCPPNYMGTSCEDCAAGHFRAQTGPFGGFCVPCQCHGHSDTCDPVTGQCFDCKHGTEGDHCERCVAGYHGNATHGTPFDCMICACPLPIASNNFADSCDVSHDGTEIACECQEGYMGTLCDSCAPGYYGQPQIVGDYCKPCNCSGNIDLDNPASCDTVSGECLVCLNNAAGPACGLCAPGFFGDAVLNKDCTQCHCDECGTSECSHSDGSCQCQENVVGDKCDRCADNHYGFATCRGCRACNCGLASESSQCDDHTGQCRCKPGTAGRNCERCASGFWNYDEEGCQSCNCNTNFSIGVGCNPLTGQCECLPGVVGEKCETCPYRWVLIPEAGCQECDSCHHNLLDVTDELQLIIAPVNKEFETITLSFFTRQKLATLNTTSSELETELSRLDVKKISFGPFEATTVELEASARSLKIKSGYVSDEGAVKAQRAMKGYVNATDLEKLIGDAVLKTKSIIADVVSLSDSLKGGTGPQLEKAYAEAKNIMQEIRSRNVQHRQSSAESELQEAINMLARMRTETLPVRDNALATSSIAARQADLKNRIADLNSKTQESQNTSQQAIALTTATRNSASLGAVEDIDSRNATASGYLTSTNQFISQAEGLLENAQVALRKLGQNAIKCSERTDKLSQAIEMKEEELHESRAVLSQAQNHADRLALQSSDLDSLLTDARLTSENAVKGATAYKNMAVAIDQAAEASLQAKLAAEDASGLSNGVGERAHKSQARSETLLSGAEAVLKDSGDLKPPLEAAQQAGLSVQENNQKTSDGLAAVNAALDKLPSASLKDSAQKAAESGTDAFRTGTEAALVISSISEQLPAQIDKARQMARDSEGASKAASLSSQKLNKLNALLPDLKVCSK